MDAIFTDITDYLLNQSGQIAVLFAVVAIICLGLKKKTAHLRYLLWLIIIAKCLVPSLVTVSLAILPEKTQPAALIEPVAIPKFTPPPEPVILSPSLRSRTGTAKNIVPPVPPPVQRPSIMAQLAQIRPKTWFSVIWLGGVSSYFIIVVIKAVRFNHRLKGERKRLTGGMQKEFNELLDRFGIRVRSRIWLLEGIGQPFVWGLLRGAIYLPANFGQIGGREHRRGILMHEIAHTLRFDAAVNLLQAIAQAIFWFHPLVWLANRNIRAEREKCCDETAIARLSAAPRVYSSAIVDTLIAEYQSSQPVPSLAIAGPIKNIEDRIKTIMKPGKKFYRRPTIIAIFTILLLAIIAVPTTIALTHRQPERPEEFLSKSSLESVAILPNCNVWLSDINGQDLPVLDLASERVVKLEHVESDHDLISRGKGDILYYYDRAKSCYKITFLRGAGLGGEPASNEYVTLTASYFDVPFVEVVTTREGNKYGVTFAGADENSCTIEYGPLKEIKDKYKAILPNGVMVELVGICEYPSGGKQWWRPDGSRLDMEIDTKDRSRYTSEDPGYEMVFKLIGKDFNFRIKDVKGSKQRSGLEVTKPERMSAYRVHIKPDLKKTNLKVGVASGRWETIGAHTGGGTTFEVIKRFLSKKKIIFSVANQTDEGLTMTVSDDLDRGKETALFAVDKNDKEYKGDIQASLFVDNMQQQTFVFDDVLLKDIKEFQFRTRPYEWLTFKNISLKPNFESEAKIDVENSQSKKLVNLFVEADSIPPTWGSFFTRLLPNGVTVELMGVCEYPSEGKKWWRPDGSELDARPYEIKNVAVSKMFGRKVLETVIKVEGFDDGIGLRYNIEGTQNSCSSGSGDQKFNGIVFDQPKQNNETNISVGVAAGQWETVQTQETNFGGVYSYRDVIWHAPVETNGKTVLNTAHTKIDQNVRFVAVDKEGKEHRSGSTSSIKEGLESMQTTFDFPLSEIKEFQFQTRPYEWVSFKNVSLKPNFKTDVEVEAVVDVAESDPEAVEIINKVVAKYAGLDSYSSEGDIVTDMDMSGVDADIVPGISDETKKKLRESKEFQDALQKSQKSKHTFSVKLARPNLYCIEWSQKVHETFTNTGAVWSTGDVHYLLNWGRKTSPKDRRKALASATGVSGGAANTIPLLFFDSPTSFLGQLQEARLEAEEPIEADLCCVIAGKMLGATMKFWVSKETLLVRQKQQILGGKFEISELSEEDIKKALEMAGVEVTDEAVQQSREQIKLSRKMSSQTKGSITETHRNIVIDQPIEPKRFIPAEAVKNEAEESLSPKEKSFNNLKALGLAMIMYANDYEGQFPDTLKQLRPYLEMKLHRWISAGNVEYVGKGKTSADNPQTVMAYNEMLPDDKATNVLFLDGHVEFCRHKRLESLGIAPAHETADAAFRVFITAAVKADSEGLKLMVQPGSGALQQISDLKQWHDLEDVSIVRTSFLPHGTSVVTTSQVTDDRGRTGQLAFTMLNANHLVSPKHKWLVTRIDFIPGTSADPDEDTQIKNVSLKPNFKTDMQVEEF
ncbi:MAG TPA: M56 family metallopeptidase [Planctomycetes bacterium]|nr:M56 family metallopeptidase [Planctomycetota bacterium]